MKVTIDYDLCEANALCTGLVPEVFEVDDEDNTNILVDEVPGGPPRTGAARGPSMPEAGDQAAGIAACPDPGGLGGTAARGPGTPMYLFGYAAVH